MRRLHCFKCGESLTNPQSGRRSNRSLVMTSRGAMCFGCYVEEELPKRVPSNPGATPKRGRAPRGSRGADVSPSAPATP